MNMEMMDFIGYILNNEDSQQEEQEQDDDEDGE